MSIIEQTSIETRIRQLAALSGFITSVLARLPFEQVQILLKNKTGLRKRLQEAFEIPTEGYKCYTEWEDFYKKYFGIIVDFSRVVIPLAPTDGEWRLIFIPAGLTLKSIIAAVRKLFKVWVYTEDLDASVTINTRTSAQSYAVWVRGGVEPDEKYLGKSTRDADMEGKIGMTLLERLVFGVKYFVERKTHLDIKGVTLCTGSRDVDGGVPGVCFDPNTGEVWVYWCSVDGSDPAYGLRQAA